VWHCRTWSSRQGDYGGRLTSCLAVDVLQRVRASLLTNSAVFFSEKVNAVRSSTDGAPEPVFFPRATWNIAGVIHFGYCWRHRFSYISSAWQKFVCWSASGFSDEAGCWWDCAVPDWVIQPFPCLLVTSHPHSKKPLSRRQLRSLGSMSQMLSHIVQSLIFRWYPSYLRGLSHSTLTPIYSPPVFCRLFSLAFGRAIRQKLLFFAFCLISCRLSTLEMSLHWCC